MADVAYIVTDLGFGDSGKGTTVDTLSHLSSEPTLVIRHNGGPQAGHNVISRDGMRHHEFAQFGSASLNGGATFLSHFMLVNPLNMELEAAHLQKIGETDIWRRTYVDEMCPVITPFHVALNRLTERARGNDRHGSCGQGVGETVQQGISRPSLTLQVRNLKPRPGTGLTDHLRELREYLRQQAQSRGVLATDSPERSMFDDSELIPSLVKQYYEWYDRVRIAQQYGGLARVAREYGQLVFEGAQGVLLDQDWGFHPYTTWSRTTGVNAHDLLQWIRWDKPVIRMGVTRAYMTRHGAGPLVTEDQELNLVEPHNHAGEWQGKFRQGYLDSVALRYALRVNGGVDQLVVTHLDRSDRWRYCFGYEHQYEGNYFYTDQIPIGQLGDLVHQQELTERMLISEPHHSVEYDESTLLDKIELELETPVGMISRGPTAGDKDMLIKPVEGVA